MREKYFNSLILGDYYITWLSNFMKDYKDIDDIYFVHNHSLSNEDRIMIDYLKDLFIELNKYAAKNDLIKENIFSYLLKYNDEVYKIEFNGEGYSCIKYDKDIKNNTCIDYKDLKKQLSKQMNINFTFLDTRVFDALHNTDLDKIRYELKKIDRPTLVSGVGGSNVVSEFVSKVLRKKNGIITMNVEPRDFVYDDFQGYDNVISCSYSGNNYGVELSFNNDKKHYLLSNNSFDNPDVTYLKYETTFPEENSFISLGATLIPISIALSYYDKNELFEKVKNKPSFDFETSCNAFEIFTGSDTSVTSKYLESTLVESGIGIPIVHDKYSYCHGRSTISINYNNVAIYLNRNTKLDNILLEELKRYYKDVIVLNSDETDQIKADFDMLIQSMYLTKYLASKKHKDLSKVDYSPLCKKLYRYNNQV